jgi:hypothetical protein
MNSSRTAVRSPGCHFTQCLMYSETAPYTVPSYQHSVYYSLREFALIVLGRVLLQPTTYRANHFIIYIRSRVQIIVAFQRTFSKELSTTARFDQGPGTSEAHGKFRHRFSPPPLPKRLSRHRAYNYSRYLPLLNTTITRPIFMVLRPSLPFSDSLRTRATAAMRRG